MAMNPYEETPSDSGFSLPDLNINVNPSAEIAQTPEPQLIAQNADVETPSTEGPPESETPEKSEPTTEIGSKEYYKEKNLFLRLPRGEFKEELANEWAMKYHGTSYKAYEAKRRSEAFIYSGSLLYDQEAMMAPAAGVLDTATDFSNLAVKNSIANIVFNKFTGNEIEIPKIPKFERDGVQAFRDISGLVIPMLWGQGVLTSLGRTAQFSGVASKSAPWLYRLGNNVHFQRFAISGINIGTGAAVDATVEQNKANDTLTTLLRQDLGWKWLPKGLDTTGDDEETKQNKNVQEGAYLGFFGDITEGLLRIGLAGRSTRRYTQYLSELDKTKQIELPGDVYRNKVYDANNPILDELQRSADIETQELKKLGEFLENTDITEPTVGIHRMPEGSSEGLIPKSLDGIIGASKDVTELANKGRAVGSLSNLLTNAARKAGVTDEVIQARSIIKTLKNDLLNAGKYRAILPNGKRLSYADIDREGTILAAVISDPTLSGKDLKKILSNFKTKLDGVQALNPVGKNAINKASINLLYDWADINTHKATAYLLASEGTQIRDLATSAGYMRSSPEAVERINEQLIDRLKLFDVESSIADYNWKAKKGLLQSIESNPTNITAKAQQELADYNQTLLTVGSKAEQFGEMLANIQKFNPDTANIIRSAYEATNGNIQSIKALNDYIKGTFGTVQNLVYNGQPAPSMWVKNLVSNVYTGILSGISTPYSALKGNFGGHIAEPLHALYGALRRGDSVQMRRYAHQYFGFVDTYQNSLKFMADTFLAASRNPDQVSNLVRRDLTPIQIANKEFNKTIAETAAKNGEFGPQAILNWSEQMEALASNPIYRSPINAMTGLDGFTEMTQRVSQAKGNAFDELMIKYPDGNWTQKEFQEVYEKIFKKNFDDAGNLVPNSGTEFARREIALNLKSDLADSLSKLTQEFPILRTIFWFPTTQMNALQIKAKYGITSRFKWGNGDKFMGDYAAFFGPYGNKTDWSPLEMKELLQRRGIDTSGDYVAKFKHQADIIRGREATGTLAIMGASFLFLQGRIRGHGHWNKSIQKTRDSQNWQRDTLQGADGKWHDLKALGPVGQWMTDWATVLDNFDSISTTKLEELGKKFIWIFASSLINQSAIRDTSNAFEIIRGNEKALKSWIATNANNLIPGSGIRTDLGNALKGGLDEVNKNDIAELIANRNKMVTGEERRIVDFITGRPVKLGEGNWWSRVKNHYSWFKSYPDTTPEGQFLIDIEFDVRPSFNTSPGGVEYSSEEKTELATLMADDGYFKIKLNQIMRKASQLEYKDKQTGETIVGYANIMKHFRWKGYEGDDISDWGNIKGQLESELRTAVRRVQDQVSTIEKIRAEEHRIKDKGYYEDTRNIEGIDRLLQLNSSN